MTTSASNRVLRMPKTVGVASRADHPHDHGSPWHCALFHELIAVAGGVLRASAAKNRGGARSLNPWVRPMVPVGRPDAAGGAGPAWATCGLAEVSFRAVLASPDSLNVLEGNVERGGADSPARPALDAARFVARHQVATELMFRPARHGASLRSRRRGVLLGFRRLGRWFVSLARALPGASRGPTPLA